MRNRHLQNIAEHGRMAWQRASGYSWRALVEADISRLKRVIGDGLRSRTDQPQATEVGIAVDALNRMLELGRPEYVRPRNRKTRGSGCSCLLILATQSHSVRIWRSARSASRRKTSRSAAVRYFRSPSAVCSLMPPEVEIRAGDRTLVGAFTSGVAFRLGRGAVGAFRVSSFGMSRTKAALAPLAVIGRLVMTFDPGSRGAAWRG
jgi:hypothetical protein